MVLSVVKIVAHWRTIKGVRLHAALLISGLILIFIALNVIFWVLESQQ